MQSIGLTSGLNETVNVHAACWHHNKVDGHGTVEDSRCRRVDDWQEEDDCRSLVMDPTSRIHRAEQHRLSLNFVGQVPAEMVALENVLT